MTPPVRSAMTPEQIAEALESLTQPDAKGRASDCPDEMLLAAYVEGNLPAEQRPSIESHLADCSRCLEVVGLLCRELDALPGEAVSPQLLTQAERRQAPADTRPKRWRSSPLLAAAASALLAVPVLMFVAGRGGAPVPGDPAIPEATRRAAPSSAAPVLLSPLAGAVVDPENLEIRWTAVPGSHFYDVRIVSDEGDPVAEQRVSGTEWRLPASTALAPHARYYVTVDAYPSENIRLGSGHVPFQVAE